MLSAARDILVEEGPAKLSLRAAARRAGVSQAAPYYHFSDKDTLLASVAAEGFKALTATMATYAKASKSPSDRLQQLGVGYVVFAVQNPEVFRLMQGPYFEDREKYDFLQEAADDSFQALSSAVTECLECADEKQKSLACAAAWALVHGTALLSMDGRISQVSDESDLEILTRKITHQLDISRALQVS